MSSDFDGSAWAGGLASVALGDCPDTVTPASILARVEALNLDSSGSGKEGPDEESVGGDGLTEIERRSLAEDLRQLIDDAEILSLSTSWIEAQWQAVVTGDWKPLGNAFAALDFLGSGDAIFIVAPYTVRRKATAIRRWSGVFGEVLPEAREQIPLGQMLRDAGIPCSAEVMRIIPFRATGTAGALRGEQGEAFVVPDGWHFNQEETGPALNNMSEQSRRFAASQHCIRRIFDEASANRLLQVMTREQERMRVQYLEYQFHEAGHAAGLGLGAKLQIGLLATWWHRAVEEWRSDGIEFELAHRGLPRNEAEALVKANLCLRLGIDAHREGGLERDQDVGCALLTLDSLLKSGIVEVRGSKLHLRDGDLMEATCHHRASALTLTHQEAGLTYPEGLHRLYGTVPVSEASRAVFSAHVLEPCVDVFQQLA
ncbi:MAG: DUF6014 family protein [Acidobacteriota bacterium]